MRWMLFSGQFLCVLLVHEGEEEAEEEKRRCLSRRICQRSRSEKKGASMERESANATCRSEWYGTHETSTTEANQQSPLDQRRDNQAETVTDDDFAGLPKRLLPDTLA